MFLTALLTISTTSVAPERLAALSQRRIFFGHQSVGASILEGISELAGDRLRIREGRSAELFNIPGLVHTAIGTNEKPLTKLEDFEAALDALHGAVDVAFLKFCFVDVEAHTDVEQLLRAYLATLARLHTKYPAVTFVRFTVPLTVVATGPKAWLKHTLTGQAPWGAQANEARHRFNALLRASPSAVPLFDLALLESTRPDGTAATYQHAGQELPQLAPEYAAADGQHLNAAGRQQVARALLTFLGDVP